MFLKKKIFAMEIPKHVLCSKHEIMNHGDVTTLVHDLGLISVLNLPKIKMDDPQCIWIGAKPGNVVKITSHGGKCIRYRVVMGNLDKKINIKKTQERIMERREILKIKDHKVIKSNADSK